MLKNYNINPLNAELNPICHLLALLGAHHILHVSRIRVKTYVVEIRYESVELIGSVRDRDHRRAVVYTRVC